LPLFSSYISALFSPPAIIFFKEFSQSVSFFHYQVGLSASWYVRELTCPLVGMSTSWLSASWFVSKLTRNPPFLVINCLL
jgi:hypothetical protein